MLIFFEKGNLKEKKTKHLIFNFKKRSTERKIRARSMPYHAPLVLYNNIMCVITGFFLDFYLQKFFIQAKCMMFHELKIIFLEVKHGKLALAIRFNVVTIN